jgi:tetratricopeptide (TPR) repeat protein
MSALFILDLETRDEQHATLRLGDAQGNPLDAWELDLAQHPPARWAALFDTGRHVRHMRDVAAPEAQLDELGRFLGEQVLGPGIAARLAAGDAHRTLLVRLPDPERDRLAAAFARVPWEIARAPGDALTLLERNVVVRAAPAGASSAPLETTIALAKGEALRVLLVFAEAPGASPLAARLERERLRDLFFKDVLPACNVEVDVLCHGVTRRRLRDQVRARGGYHVVHWSGHGHVDTLALALEAGEAGCAEVSGAELVGLFAGGGGFIPPVVFLSACHSGALVDVKDWASLQASLRGPGARAATPGALGEKVGFTGTALSLVQAGVQQVVAMRYEVGDRYARRLARRFYRGLLVDAAHHAVDAALALARKELKKDEGRKGEYEAVDHATPLVLGSARVRVVPESKASAQMDRRGPRPQPLLPSGSKELDPPHGFMGRGEELTRLRREWVEAGGCAVALIQGLAGLGKTSLAAEVIHLWFDRFDYVLCFQARGGALGIEDFLRQLDHRLALASPAYRERCQANAMARVYLAPEPALTGEVRAEALRNNLVDVLGRERILLVLDNFETNLLGWGGPDGYAAQDPAWDRLLEALGDRLRGTGSRVLVTSRHKPAALASAEHALWIPLGPLPIGEARLFFEGQRPIRDLLFGDAESQQLARRILDVSRGHPLILARIGDLARAHYDKGSGLTAGGRKALGDALDRIQGEGFKTLPDVFVGTKSAKEREKERAYLEEVAVGAIDLLIDRLTVEGRQLLWTVTRAGEPLPESMLSGAPAELLGALCEAGLMVRDGEAYGFHELVAERAAAWMVRHPDELAGRTEADVWTAFGTQYGALFQALVEAKKREQASEAGRRGIRYLVRARAFEELGDFASGVIIGTSDPVLLRQVIADLQGAAAEAPEGRARWSLRTYLADALDGAGRPDQALPFYAQAAEEAEAAEHWAHVGSICHNWANALGYVGQLEVARETYLRSAEAQRRRGSPRVNIVMSELESLRVEVMQGRAAEALPAIEAKLGELRSWWAQRGQGKDVPEARHGETLARTLICGLDIAQHTHSALEHWQATLDLLEELEQVDRDLGTGEHELGRSRFNRYEPLMKLGKLDEARAVLEGCLEVFRQAGDVTMEAKALSALADAWDELGDPAQALLLARRALAVCEHLPDPRDRATSHHNLASYLHTNGAIGEARDHQLADVVYCVATGLDLRGSLHNLTIRIRQAATRGEPFTFPPLATLLAAPAFAPLRAFLTERALPLPALQTRIDQLVDQARAALSTPTPPG